MDEAELLARILAHSSDIGPRDGVLLGPGDDCAILAPIDAPLLLTTDQLVEGRHYTLGTTPSMIARKAVARSVSDIAAMGGRPIATLVAGTLPPGLPDGDELCRQLHAWADRLGAPIVGGDLATAEGRMVLSTTVLGRSDPPRRPVRRAGAAVGDLVGVTGTVGASFQTGWHLEFTPRVEEGLWLAGGAGLADRLHAMIDVSDGVGTDAARIAEASGVRLEIDLAALPLRDAGQDPCQAVRDGEDYELLFTALPPVPPTCPNGTPISVIGRVVAGAGCIGLGDPRGPVDLARAGWSH